MPPRPLPLQAPSLPSPSTVLRSLHLHLGGGLRPSCVRSEWHRPGCLLPVTPRGPWQAVASEPRHGVKVRRARPGSLPPPGPSGPSQEVDGRPLCPWPAYVALLALYKVEGKGPDSAVPFDQGGSCPGRSACHVPWPPQTAGHLWAICLKPVPFLRLFASLWVS